ncbi:MAG: hypothetical protein OHK0019_16850 [Saprospiraceae bacterium]
MENINEISSNEYYINGLRAADEAVLEAIYTEFRQPVVRAVAALGGSDATGRAFFRYALVEAAKQLQTGALTPEMPFSEQLQRLAIAHYKDWLTEREQPSASEGEAPPPTETELFTPTSEALRETRATIDCWKKGEQTEGELHQLWQKLRRIEGRLSDEKPPKPKSHFARNLFILFALLTVAWLIWLYGFRSKSPAEVYDANFSLPESIMSDLRHRYGPERGNDSVSSRPSACEFYLREADVFYKAKDFESAQIALAGILEDSLATCHSDALYYIGILGLQQEQPELALECFSKIEDLEHFGEDLYWYQALAFVKLAEKNPLLRDKAVRAIERTRSNSQDSLRRVQAEKMLEHLGD